MSQTDDDDDDDRRNSVAIARPSVRLAENEKMSDNLRGILFDSHCTMSNQ